MKYLSLFLIQLCFLGTNFAKSPSWSYSEEGSGVVIITGSIVNTALNKVYLHAFDEFQKRNQVKFIKYEFDDTSKKFKIVFNPGKPTCYSFFFKDIFVTPGDSVNIDYVILDTATNADTLIVSGVNAKNYLYYTFFEAIQQNQLNPAKKTFNVFDRKSYLTYLNDLNKFYDSVELNFSRRMKIEKYSESFSKRSLNDIKAYKLLSLTAPLLNLDRTWMDSSDCNLLRNMLINTFDSTSTLCYSAAASVHTVVSIESNFDSLANDYGNYNTSIRNYLVTNDLLQVKKNLIRVGSMMFLNKWIYEVDNPRYRELLKNEQVGILFAKEFLMSKFDHIMLIDLAGRVVSLSKLLGSFEKHIVYVDFWATWCKPCIADSKFLEKISKMKPELKIIQISIDEDAKAWEIKSRNQGYSFAARYRLINVEDYKYIFSLLKFNSVEGAVPQYVIVNKEGAIVNQNAPRPSEYKKLINFINTMAE